MRIFLSCLLSAALLDLSFPQMEWAALAWVALVPLFCVIDGERPWLAFRRAYLCGFLFFAATLGWIVYVTWVCTILLVAFLALYFALFGLAFVYCRRFSLIPRIFILSSVWVAVEYTRGHLFSGFGWVMLGHTQYKNLWLIQIADTTGVYGISFLVMLVNLLVFENWRKRTFLTKANTIVAAILAAVLAYGCWTMNHPPHEGEVKIGLVQPNIPLTMDWDENQKPWIVGHDIQLSQKLAAQNLDLIVWPETSLPGMIDDSPFLTHLIRASAAQMHTSLVIGSVAQDAEDYYNSAFLIGSSGQKLGRYDKIHLVPFGEYLPLRPVLGWVTKIVPLDDFTSGKHYKVFTLVPSGKKFSVLICFEDTLSNLCRRFSQNGAQFFVNITNDAWFRQTKQPFLHLQGAVFNCVENHRSLARAANTGVSALVDPWGRVTAMVRDGHGQKIFIEGTVWGTLPLETQKTFYTKYGDIFTCLCFLCILLAALKR